MNSLARKGKDLSALILPAPDQPSRLYWIGSGRPFIADRDSSWRYTAVGRFLGGVNDDKNARVIALMGEEMLKKLSKSAKRSGVVNVATEIRIGDYASCILEVANETDADLIVMGRRGLSNLKGFVTGSVSHKVSQRAECSVLTVKKQAVVQAI